MLVVMQALLASSCSVCLQQVGGGRQAHSPKQLHLCIQSAFWSWQSDTQCVGALVRLLAVPYAYQCVLVRLLVCRCLPVGVKSIGLSVGTTVLSGVVIG